jgi:hypothetical protein
MKMNYLKLRLLLAFLPIAFVCMGQTPAEYEANYAARIKMEMINGVYIPNDLMDAFDELNRLSAPAGLAEFKSSPEDSVRRKLHFGLGRWILINWGLEEGSRISDYMKKHGVAHPDDMVEVIIITWHRHLNGQSLKFNEEVAIIDKRLQEEKAKRDGEAQKTILEKKPHKE